jgi:hypothetical protein
VTKLGELATFPNGAHDDAVHSTTQPKIRPALHFAWYNFCRVHSSLRVTRAMPVEITNFIWTLNQLLA